MTDTGLFVGRRVDPATGKTGGEALRLDADDLTTHGLIVGMTGSGKTALGIVLIEELLLRGIPVLAIDPKGDLGNLLLDFPSLAPSEFAPFMDAASGTTPAAEAKRWSDGLAGWGLGATDVAALAASREATLYTPGSTAGTPLDLLGSLAPPPKSADEEDRRDLVTAFVSGLLGLIGIDADPMSSRELILLSRCVEAAWSEGRTATLESLIAAASSPPFASVGALPIETFFPAKERQTFVLALNNLFASPSTAAFRKGAPLDVAAMMSPGRSGKPRLSVVSIAALSDAERSFVVATLLARVVSWMRSQPGSPHLRAFVYIDEIFGFFPPSAEPPPKKPLLTLLKQARAFGTGIVLATQNPVDLDYKGLANCGCWFVGTLQTERDRKRLAEGLSSATGSKEAVSLLDATRKRVFLLHDVHAKGPALFETRWAMSWLRGPMTREDIARSKGKGPGGETVADAQAPVAAASTSAPPVPSPWPSKWVALRDADIAAPRLFVRYAVRYHDGASSAPETSGVRLFPLDAPSAGEVLEGESVEIPPSALKDAPPRALRYAELPAWLGPAAVRAVEKAVRERLPDRLSARLLRDTATGALSAPGETPDAFAKRVGTVSAPPGLAEKLEKKKRDLQAAESAQKGRELETYATIGNAALDVLGGLLGKRKSVRLGKVGSVLTKKRMEGTAESRVEGLRAEVAELETKLAPPDTSRFVGVDVVPLKAHVDVLSIGVAWVA